MSIAIRMDVIRWQRRSWRCLLDLQVNNSFKLRSHCICCHYTSIQATSYSVSLYVFLTVEKGSVFFDTVVNNKVQVEVWTRHMYRYLHSTDRSHIAFLHEISSLIYNPRRELHFFVTCQSYGSHLNFVFDAFFFGNIPIV